MEMRVNLKTSRDSARLRVSHQRLDIGDDPTLRIAVDSLLGCCECRDSRISESLTMLRPMFSRLPAVLLALMFVLLLPGADAQTLNPHEEEMLAYEKHDREEPPRRGAILFLGGNLFKTWEPIGQDFPPSLTIVGRGFSSWSMKDSVLFAARTSIVYQPRLIVLQAGSVDLREGRTPGEVLELFKSYVATVRAKLPRTRIIFLSLSPSFRSWNNRAAQIQVSRFIAEYAAGAENVGFIDIWTPMLAPDGTIRSDMFMTDSYQPSRESYLLRAKIIAPHLR